MTRSGRTYPRSRVWQRAAVLLLGVAAIAAAPAGRPAHAGTSPILCQQEIDYRVDFTSGTAHGDSEYSTCVSATHPAITHGFATANGTITAGSTPDNVTINETLDVVWKNALGSTVATSTITLTRRFVGPENAMVQQGNGTVVDGTFINDIVVEADVVVGTVQRQTNPDGSVTYRYPEYYKGSIAYADFGD